MVRRNVLLPAMFEPGQYHNSLVLVQLEVVAHFRFRIQQRMTEISRCEPVRFRSDFAETCNADLSKRSFANEFNASNSIPGVEPARKQMREVFLQKLEPVREDEVPRHQQMDQEPE